MIRIWIGRNLSPVFLIFGLVFSSTSPINAHVAVIHKNIVEGMWNAGHRYCTYDVELDHIERFFMLKKGLLTQRWNKNYVNAQGIFSTSPLGKLRRAFIHFEHVKMHSKKFWNTEIADIQTGEEFLDLMFKEKAESRFNYVILADGHFRFAESSDGVKDMLAKHVILADRAREVIYAGEFFLYHHRGERILVINNNSGTYAPSVDHDELRRLKSLLVDNFPGLQVVSVSYSVKVTDENIEEFL